ncbi:MAG: monovalent cation/H(+) antiporter subunit G [Gammaproteobacteria bacterium]|nr:monovalent cation/H(+) antiporter subunit G [Gammaproteobacteria bacterium]
MVVNVISYFLLVTGAFFVITGTMGVIRLPDFYTRLHAASLVETLGCILIVTGLIIQAGLSLISVKLLLVIGLILFTSPVATHALAKAATHGGVMPEVDE